MNWYGVRLLTTQSEVPRSSLDPHRVPHCLREEKNEEGTPEKVKAVILVIL